MQTVTLCNTQDSNPIPIAMKLHVPQSSGLLVVAVAWRIHTVEVEKSPIHLLISRLVPVVRLEWEGYVHCHLNDGFSTFLVTSRRRDSGFKIVGLRHPLDVLTISAQPD